MEHIRHGDVLITKVDSLDIDPLKPQKDKALLEGEVTGHAHRLKGGEVWRKQTPTLDDQFWLGGFTVKEDTPLTHEEHGTHVFTPGTYKHYGQVEFDPVSEYMVKD